MFLLVTLLLMLLFRLTVGLDWYRFSTRQNDAGYLSADVDEAVLQRWVIRRGVRGLLFQVIEIRGLLFQVIEIMTRHLRLGVIASR